MRKSRKQSLELEAKAQEISKLATYSRTKPVEEVQPTATYVPIASAQEVESSEIQDQDNPTFRSIKTPQEITEDWAAKQKSNESGGNTYILDFLLVAKFLMENPKDTFDLNSYFTLSRHLDSPPAALAPLYHSWLEELLKHKRVKKLSHVYSFPTYVFI